MDELEDLRNQERRLIEWVSSRIEDARNGRMSIEQMKWNDEFFSEDLLPELQLIRNRIVSLLSCERSTSRRGIEEQESDTGKSGTDDSPKCGSTARLTGKGLLPMPESMLRNIERRLAPGQRNTTGRIAPPSLKECLSIDLNDMKDKLKKDWLVLDVSEWDPAKGDREAIDTFIRLLTALNQDPMNGQIRFANHLAIQMLD